MAIYTYREFRQVLRREKFQMVRSGKHEIWRKYDEKGRLKYQVIVKHQRGKDIPKSIFHAMLRQVGLTEKEFARILRGEKG